jgi:hypothetical protein
MSSKRIEAKYLPDRFLRTCAGIFVHDLSNFPDSCSRYKWNATVDENKSSVAIMEAHMSGFSKRTLFWTPRVLSIIFIAFLSLFALDVFNGHAGLWRTLLALTMHLIPSFVLIAALVLAWRWEWIGAVLYGAAGLLYVTWVVSMSRPVPPTVRLVWILTIGGPAFIIAALFLANWLKHDQLRARDGKVA